MSFNEELLQIRNGKIFFMKPDTIEMVAVIVVILVIGSLRRVQISCLNPHQSPEIIIPT